MVGPAVPGANIGGRIVLTGVPTFLANANKIIKAYEDISKAALNTSNVVSRSPVAAGQAPSSRATRAAGGIRPRTGGFVGTSQRAGPFQAAAGIGGFGAGPLAAAASAAAALAVGLAAATAAVLKLGAGFQEAQRSVAVFGGTTQEQLTANTQTVLQLSAAWGVSAENVSAGGLALIKAGVPIEAVNAGLLKQVVVLEQASQGEVDMAQGADLLTQIITIYEPKLISTAKETGDWTKVNEFATNAVNTLVGAVQNSTAGFDEFALQLKFVTPVAKIMGISLEETTAQLAILNNAGIRGETAGTALRNSWLRMIKPTKEAREAMNEFGISVVTTGDEMADAEALVTQLENAFGEEAVMHHKITEAQRAEGVARIFNTRQILAGVAIAEQGSEAFRRMLAAQKAVSAEELASSLQFGVNKQLGLLAKQLEVVALQGFLPFETGLTNVILVINKLVRESGIQEFATRVGEAINSIITLQNPFINAWIKMAAAADVLFGEAVVNVIATIGKVVDTLTGQLFPTLGQTESFLTQFADAFVTAFAGVKVGSEILLENADAISGFILTLVNDVKSGFPAIQQQIETSIASVIQIFNNFREALADPGAFFSGLFDSMVTSISAAIPAVLAELNILTNGISGFLIQIGTNIVNRIAGTFNFVVEVVTDIVNIIGSIVTAIGPTLVDAANTIIGVFGQAFSNLVTDVGAAVTGILTIWDTLAGGLIEIVTTTIVPLLDGLIQAVQGIVQPIIDAVVAWVRGWGTALKEWVRIVVAAVNKVIETLRVIARIGSSLPGLGAIDAAFKVFDELSARLAASGGSVSAAGAELEANLADAASGIVKGASVGAGIIAKGVHDFGERVQAQVQATRASINEAFSKLQTDLQKPAPLLPQKKTTPAAPGGVGSPRFPAPGGGGGGGAGGGAKENADQLAQRIFDALNGIIPAMTKDLAEFLASIAKDFPARLQPMLQSLVDARDIIGQMVLLKKDMVAVDLQLIGVEQRIADINQQQHILQLQADISSAGFDKQLIQLGFQKLQIEQQMAPLEDAIADIDAQINKLQRENLVLSQQRLEIEIQMLPIKRHIEDIEKQITDLQKENLNLTGERLRFEGLILPIKNRVAALDKEIERVGQRNFNLEREALNLTKEQLPLQRQIQVLQDQITDSVDKRQQLLNKKQELIAEKDVAGVQHALDDITFQLEDAWTKFDVPKILKLEESKRLLEEQLKAAEHNLGKIKDGQEDAQRDADIANTDIEIQIAALEELLKPLDRRQQAIEHTQAVQENLNAITKLGLEEQKAGLEAIIQPWQDIVDLITQEADAEDFRAKVAINGLEKEKKALEDQLAPLDAKLQAIARQVEEENLRNQLTINHLEQEKRALEDQLEPLEKQRKAIERSTKEIQFQRAQAREAFEEQMADNKAKLEAEELNRASLEETRAKQEKVFLELFQHFHDAISASGVFTLEEAAEVTKRLKLWDDQNNKLLENVAMFARLQGAADLAAEAIRKIDRDIVIHVTTVYETRGQPGPGTPSVGPITVTPSTPSAPPSGGDVGVLVPANNLRQTFQHGGIVRGPFGQPMWVVAHAGERILPLATVPHRSDFVRSRESSAGMTNIIYNNITNFEVNPSYSQVDSPVSIREDLRALVMAMR